MNLPQPASTRLRTSYRRRRVLWVFALATILAIVFFAPTSFWFSSAHDREDGVSFSGATRAIQNHAPAKTKSIGGAYNDNALLKEIELKNLLHMVVSSDRTIPADANTDKPLVLNAYAADVEAVAWLTEMENDPPLIVFSKVSYPLQIVAVTRLISLEFPSDLLPVRKSFSLIHA